MRTELAWREFYADVLWHHPDSARAPLLDVGARLHWDSGEKARERFAAWATGTTGYPLVDAGMRQLLAEGWMHNRVRMVTASFLVKDLHIDWRLGARWFMWHLVDGDLASNQHGWQWVAGTGTDAAPFHRVLNPVRQQERFDPAGLFVSRYLDAGPGVDPSSGVVVDHATERRVRWSGSPRRAEAPRNAYENGLDQDRNSHSRARASGTNTPSVAYVPDPASSIHPYPSGADRRDAIAKCPAVWLVSRSAGTGAAGLEHGGS